MTFHGGAARFSAPGSPGPIPTARGAHSMPRFRPVVLVAVAAVLVAAIVGRGADDPPGGKSRAPFRSRPAPKERPQRPVGAGPATAPAVAAPQPAGPMTLRTGLPDAARRPRTEAVMEVAPIDRARRGEVNAAAAAIDALIDRLSPPSGREEGLDDALFARRAYLQLGGRIPTPAEMVGFLEKKGPRKREELVDALLESPDWVSHLYNLWASTLRLKDMPQSAVYWWPYLDWVKRSIADNRPYDAWVREMLTADGRPWENPAVGYQLRDQGMPLISVDHTLRVFLGTQMGCAQCHDHPFDDWKQRQFYEIAAYTAGTRSGIERPRRTATGEEEPDPLVANWVRLTKEIQERARGSTARAVPIPDGFISYLMANRIRVACIPAELALPHDYRYDDGRPGDVIEPRVPWGEEPAAAAELDPRRRFAAWVTSADNPRFPRTIANRLWKFCFGVGIVEPVDDFRDGNPPSHPELLDHLADLIVALDFDTREFVRVVVSTRAWQRRAVAHDPTSANPFPFRSPALRRMTAEQTWDSMLTLVAHDIWAYQRPRYESYGLLREFDLGAEEPELSGALAVFERFQGQLSARAVNEPLWKTLKFHECLLARASELSQPQPMGSFLREFGQGDRETIDGSRVVATLPQVLMLLHGHHGLAVIDDGSAIMQAILSTDPERGTDVAFLGILGRAPEADDRRTVASLVAAAATPLEAFRDVVWALVNTREFLFIQ